VALVQMDQLLAVPVQTVKPAAASIWYVIKYFLL
jgi:hypothetical protein